MTAFNQFFDLFSEVWVEGVFGVNVSEVIIGLTIFLFFYVLRRLFARFLINRLSKIVLKSSNKLDDTIIEVIEGPLKFLPVVIGFFVASSYIDFSLTVQNFIDLLNRSLITIFIFWLLYQLVIPFSFFIKKFEKKI
jgi:MscS family membrane protein